MPDDAADPGLTIEPGHAEGAVDAPKAASVAEALREALKDVNPADDAAEAEDAAGGEAPAVAAQAAPAKEAPKETPPPAPPQVDEVAALVAQRRRNRDQHEKAMRAIEGERAQLQARLLQHETELQTKYAAMAEAAAALDAGDLDGFAAAIGKHRNQPDLKDWNTLQQEAIKTLAQGGEVRAQIRQLKAEQAARDARDKAEREAAQQRAAQEQRSRQEAEWIADISDSLATDQDKAVAEVFDADPNFANFVYQTQQRHYRETGEVLPAREAATATIKTLFANVTKWNAWAAKHGASAFVQQTTGLPAPQPKPENGTAARNSENGTAAPVKAAKKGKTPAVSQNRTAEASALGHLSPRELIRQFTPRLEDALREDPQFGGRTPAPRAESA